MKQYFKSKNFGPEALSILTEAVRIVNSYQIQGYTLSLRQLYYQLVSKNSIPNTDASYKMVGNIIADARLAGMVDWDMIEDRGRETVTPQHWRSPTEIIEACSQSYKIDKWKRQPNHVEVMVEKQALEGVLEPVCRELDIPFTANKGYSSMTMMYNTGQRLKRRFIDGAAAKALIPLKLSELHTHRKIWADFLKHMDKNHYAEKFLPTKLTEKGVCHGLPRIVVFYLGDHDPSGMDMTRDVEERLGMFSDFTPMVVRRIALNMPQIEEYQPPENPAKLTDSRAKKYISEFGDSSWELDALDASVLADLVRNAVLKLRDEKIWEEDVARELAERKKISALIKKIK